VFLVTPFFYFNLYKYSNHLELISINLSYPNPNDYVHHKFMVKFTLTLSSIMSNWKEVLFQCTHGRKLLRLILYVGLIMEILVLL